MGTRRVKLAADDGFTLIEVIIGMVITGIILGAIAGALIVSLRTTDVTQQRMSESHDAQITSAYLANDVQSAAGVDVSTAIVDCGVSSPTRLVTFTYANGGSAVYQCGTTAGQTQVTRAFGGATVVIAHFAGNARPQVTCTPAPCTSTPPNAVTISFVSSGGYTYTLLGSRRALNPSGVTGTPSTPDLTLLATGTPGNSPLWVKGGCKKTEEVDLNCTFDPSSQNDKAKLTVNGNLYVNAAVNGAVKVTGHGSISATGSFKILQGGTCQGCNNGNVSPWPVGSYTPALLDPLRFMTYPTSATTGSCGGGVCTPGVFASQLTINASVTMQPGVYILRNGLSIQGNATVSGNGVMLFIEGGNLSFAGGSRVNLTPPTSGTYKNVLIFQSRSDTSALSLSGGTALNQAQFAGIVYAPASTSVTLGTGGANMHVFAVIAQNIVVTGNSAVTIGA